MSNDLQDLRAVSTVKDRLPWLPYLAAAVLSAVAIGVRYMVSGPDAVAGPVYIVLVLPIGLAAYFGGFGPGLLSTLLTTLGAEVVLLEPVGGLFGAPLRMRLGLLMLGVIGVLVSLAARQLYAARAIVAVDAHELEHAAALSERDRHLQHLQGQLEHIVATAPGVIYAFRRRADGTEGFTYASAGSARLLGVSFEEMERDTSALFAMMDPGDAEEGARKIDVSARDLTPWRHQFRLRRPDGEERWIEAHSIPSREADGETLWHGFMSDITARKSAERALDAARETMEILIEQSPVAIAMFDTSMTFLAASGRWCEQFGYETDELIGHSLYSVVPEIPERWRRLHADAIAGTSWQDDHDQWRLKDGKFHDVRWAIHPWRAETGAIGGVILFAEDVTEANAAARRLAASEQRYRDLVNMSPEAIFLTRDSKIVYANPAALAVLGAQALDDVLGRDAVEFLHPDERDHMQAAREHLQAGETLPPTQRRFVRLDGTAIQVEVVARPYQDAEGPAVQTVVHDITDRIRQEEALRETSTRFRQLAESIREAFYLADESRTRVRYLSAAAREIFGRAEDEFTAGIGTWRTIIHGADRERVTEVLQGVLQGHAFDLEYRIVRGDGTVRWVRDRASAVRDTRGTIVGIAGLVEDVTERRVLESQLQQASKIESVGLLAGGIAHDFNNLLTVINGNAELLEHLDRGAGGAGARSPRTRARGARRGRARLRAHAPTARVQPEAGGGAAPRGRERRRRRHGEDAAPPAGELGRAAHRTRSGARCAPRSGPARPGAHQPGGQRPRRDAERWAPDDPDRRGGGRAELQLGGGVTPSAAHRHRHR
jgi:PAS domain S-box-containing protein